MKPRLTVRRRRLGEISIAHGFLRNIFARSSFEGSAEFEHAVAFASSHVDGAVAPSAQVIRRLLRWYDDGKFGVTCRVFDAGAIGGGMLWLQASLDRLMEGLSADRPTVLLLTGTREAVRPTGRRWSSRAERERKEILHWVERRVENWSRRMGAPVSLLVT